MQSLGARLATWTLTAAFGAWSAAAAVAAPVGLSALADFNSQVAGLGTVVTVDFESATLPAGLTISGSTAAGPAPSVRNQPGLWSPSGTGFLGVDDPNNLDQFSGGDSITFQFATALRAFGLYVVAGRDILPGDFSLGAGGATQGNGDQADALADGQGSFAYFLGFVAPTAADAFDQITLTSTTAFSYFFAVDDLRFAGDRQTPQVPEPATPALVLLAALGAWAARRRATPPQPMP